jgi:hypothetical protein
MGGNEVRLE